MNPTLLNDSQVSVVKTTQASAGTAINSASVDMQGWEGVLFVAAFATANAGNSANLAQSSDDATFNDLEGTKQTPAGNGDLIAIDLYQPTKRYVRLEVDRSGANTVIETVYAIRYRGRKGRQVSVATQEIHVSPNEGTA